MSQYNTLDFLDLMRLAENEQDSFSYLFNSSYIERQPESFPALYSEGTQDYLPPSSLPIDEEDEQYQLYSQECRELLQHQMTEEKHVETGDNSSLQQVEAQIVIQTTDLNSEQPEDRPPRNIRREQQRQRRVPKNNYPTKNFLCYFRNTFLNYLGQFFDELEFEKIKIVNQIRSRNNYATLEDYEELLNLPLFRPYLTQYFKHKIIYRDLAVSRNRPNTKRNYFKRIHVFEETFLSGKFDKINY